MISLNAANPVWLDKSEPEPQFVEAVQAMPCWDKLPYRFVAVALPDGSSFQLRAIDLAARAATALQMPGCGPMCFLLAQVLPLIQEYPEFLLEMASQLRWPDARKLAKNAFWRSPCDSLAPKFENGAQLSLHA